MAVDAFMFPKNGDINRRLGYLAPTYGRALAGDPSPPPPPPPPLFKGHSLSITDSLRNRQSNKLKPLLWSSLKSAEQGSMWAEIQNPDEARQVLEINMSELESLFLRESREEEQAAARFLPPQ
nr:hypothetical protein [Tanacetum cinerariifolium]